MRRHTWTLLLGDHWDSPEAPDYAGEEAAKLIPADLRWLVWSVDDHGNDKAYLEIYADAFTQDDEPTDEEAAIITERLREVFDFHYGRGRLRHSVWED